MPAFGRRRQTLEAATVRTRRTIHAAAPLSPVCLRNHSLDAGWTTRFGGGGRRRGRVGALPDGKDVEIVRLKKPEGTWQTTYQVLKPFVVLPTTLCHPPTLTIVAPGYGCSVGCRGLGTGMGLAVIFGSLTIRCSLQRQQTSPISTRKAIAFIPKRDAEVCDGEVKRTQ